MKEQEILTLATALLGSGVIAVIAKWALARFARPAPTGYKRVIRVEKDDGTVLVYEADEDEIVTRSDAKKILKWLNGVQQDQGADAVRSFSYSLVPKDEVADAERMEDTDDPGALPPA